MFLVNRFSRCHLAILVAIASVWLNAAAQPVAPPAVPSNAESALSSDVLYRILVGDLALQRGDDTRLLAEYFLEFYSRHHKRRIKGFTQSGLRAIQAHPWPGNVRELENRVQRAVILALPVNLPVQGIEADARIAWNDRRIGMGLQFSKVDPADQQAIDNFVDAHFFTNRKK